VLIDKKFTLSLDSDAFLSSLFHREKGKGSKSQ